MQKVKKAANVTSLPVLSQIVPPAGGSSFWETLSLSISLFYPSSSSSHHHPLHHLLHQGPVSCWLFINASAQSLSLIVVVVTVWCLCKTKLEQIHLGHDISVRTDLTLDIVSHLPPPAPDTSPHLPRSPLSGKSPMPASKVPRRTQVEFWFPDFCFFKKKHLVEASYVLPILTLMSPD